MHRHGSSVAVATEHQGACIIQECVEARPERGIIRKNTTWNFLGYLRDQRFCTCAKIRIRLQRREGAVEIEFGQGFDWKGRVILIVRYLEMDAFEPRVLCAPMRRGLNFVRKPLLVSFDRAI